MLNGKAAYMNSFITNPSKPQVELFEMIKEVVPESILNYPIIELNYCIDIGIPDLMIAFEYDGGYWHQDKEADDRRQSEIEKLGWKFIRFKDRIPTMEELKEKINELI